MRDRVPRARARELGSAGSFLPAGGIFPGAYFSVQPPYFLEIFRKKYFFYITFSRQTFATPYTRTESPKAKPAPTPLIILPTHLSTKLTLAGSHYGATPAYLRYPKALKVRRVLSRPHHGKSVQGPGAGLPDATA